jgi:hypothetical protein
VKLDEFFKGTKSSWFGVNKMLKNATKGITLVDGIIECLESFFQMFSPEANNDLVRVKSQYYLKIGTLFVRIIGVTTQEKDVGKILQKAGLDSKYLQWLTVFLTKNKIGVQ